MKPKILAGLAAVLIIGGSILAVTLSSDDAGSQSSSSDNSPSASQNDEEQSGSGVTFNTDIEDYLKTGTDTGSQDATDKTEVSVAISSFEFAPYRLKIKAGTTVTWTNSGSVRHDVTSWDKSPNKGLGSDLLADGESYEFTFDEVGTYVYFCSPHPFQMRGAIEVVES